MRSGRNALAAYASRRFPLTEIPRALRHSFIAPHVWPDPTAAPWPPAGTNVRWNRPRGASPGTEPLIGIKERQHHRRHVLPVERRAPHGIRPS